MFVTKIVVTGSWLSDEFAEKGGDDYDKLNWCHR
jgi:hypothetical protein